MQTAQFRFAVLSLVFAVGIGLYATVAQSVQSHPPRWPSEDALVGAAGWTAGPPTAPEATSSYPVLSRTYTRTDGTSPATLTIMTGSDPKIYRAGADVPFLGSGFETQALPAGLVTPSATWQGLSARRGSEQWLLLYAYGEGRGLIGNGLVGWAMAIGDGLLSQSNDYYKLFLARQVDDLNSTSIGQTAQLADALFPRVAATYALDSIASVSPPREQDSATR